ncbi:DUF86 domain-containing protein [Mucilaginibacter sp. BJC16-A38]|uniref:HepT-like ribonuclease domain-containing protein n=1 Tax=Mucilaginibacter phenanthrenivorans TaxID=1234842 RepID=UPI00215774BC|nr:DUF86 domain-containing protein [Mucilaginibacter phenanthrenivorans]MCR8558488.1 DUF86 domain-containing protein [Mucilaginibacter phenanthrenivorans]
MSRSDHVYLQDILESIEMILGYIGSKTEFEFVNDLMLQDAVVRRFEIIGEASSKISEVLKIQNPEIQWRLMKGMRNKLIHEYFGVSPITIYLTVQQDLPVLKEQLAKIVN